MAAEITLLDYANEREFVVAFYTSTAAPAGDYAPLGNPDLDFVERRGLLDLVGTVDSEGDWQWSGEGEPTDDNGNSILKVHAYVSPQKWAELEYA